MSFAKGLRQLAQGEQTFDALIFGQFREPAQNFGINEKWFLQRFFATAEESL